MTSYISVIEEILMIIQGFLTLIFPLVKKSTMQQGITSALKLLKDKIIDKTSYKNVKPVGSRPGILYGLEKMHKENKKGLPPFCSILSAIGTPTYKLAKFLLPFLTRLTENEYNVTDLFHFAEEICKQDSNLYMASLDDDLYMASLDFENTPKILKNVFFSICLKSHHRIAFYV